MKKLHVIAVVLALLSIATLLVGCGDEGIFKDFDLAKAQRVMSGEGYRLRTVKNEENTQLTFEEIAFSEFGTACSGADLAQYFKAYKIEDDPNNSYGAGTVMLTDYVVIVWFKSAKVAKRVYNAVSGGKEVGEGFVRGVSGAVIYYGTQNAFDTAIGNW